MKKVLLPLMVLVFMLITATKAKAIDNNTVTIVYDGATAKVEIADNISQYVTVTSGTSSHVKLVQAADFEGVDANKDNEDGEIIYQLSGSSEDGEFYMEGGFKCTVELFGLTLTNPSGPAINVQNGKRIDVSAKKGTTNTLVDGANDEYKGCFHSKGHTEFKGKGVLNVVGNSKHAVYSKEYIELKNLTLNITGAVKDAIHCKQYFLMESGTVNITGAANNGITVEMDGNTSTGITADHKDEDTGNFYMEDGTLAISGYGNKAIVADGTITYSGGTQDFDTNDTSGVNEIKSKSEKAGNDSYDLLGRQVTHPAKGIYIQNGKKYVR